MERGIRLSEKHGVNPSVMLCFLCGESYGVALLGKHKDEHSHDAEAPREGVYEMEPCGKCKAIMEHAIICISVDEEKSDDMQNPYRTGGWCAIKEEAFKRIGVPQELEDAVLRRRVMFLPDNTWDLIGLPRGKIEGVPSTYGELAEAQA